MKNLVHFIISFFILFFVLSFFSSCYPPIDNQLSSRDDGDRDDDDRDDDDDDRPSINYCSEKDSCQDTCDDLFDHSSERFECYDLHHSDVNTLAEVSDVFFSIKGKADAKTVNVKKFTVSDLEDLSADEFSSYLEIGIETFIDRVDSVDGDKWGVMPITHSNEFLEWVAENEDIAEVLLEQDENLELAQQIFIKQGSITLTENDGGNFCVAVNNDDDKVRINEETGSCSGYNSTTDLNLFNLSDFDEGPVEFVSGFAASVSGNTFIELAFDERNDVAFQWAHNALLDFCVEGTDEDEDEVEVKQCLQIVYCITGDQDFVFDELDEQEDIIGRTEVRSCEYDRLINHDTIENVFE